MGPDMGTKLSEQAYIITSDLKSVRIARDILKDVIPANNPYVGEEEYRAVRNILADWQERMSAKIETV